MITGTALPPDLETLVRGELRPGERLVWTGRPRPWDRARPMVFVALVGLVFTVVAGAMIGVTLSAAATAPKPPPRLFLLAFVAFMLPFFVIGLLMVGAPVFAWRAANRSAYALTDRRAIVIRAGARGRRTVTSYPASRLGLMHRTERPDGSGDLIFDESREVVTKARGRAWARSVEGFLAVDGVAEIEALVRRILSL